MIETLFDVLGNFYHQGNFSEAERIAGIITQVVPDDDVSMQLSGLLCYRMGRREEASQAYNRAATSSFAVRKPANGRSGLITPLRSPAMGPAQGALVDNSSDWSALERRPPEARTAATLAGKLSCP